MQTPYCWGAAGFSALRFLQVYDIFGHSKKKGAAAEQQWKENMQQYKEKYPEVPIPWLL